MTPTARTPRRSAVGLAAPVARRAVSDGHLPGERQCGRCRETPRREIVSGTIKANLPTCVGLRVSSGAEARIIETPGADLLLGHGDLILKSIGEPQRLQGALLPAAGCRELAGAAADVAE